MSCGWVLMHAYTLPLGSAFMAELRGGKEFRGWDETRYMLASVYNAINILKHVTVLAHINPEARPPEAPEPHPTPDNLKARTAVAETHEPGSFGSIATTLLTKAKKSKGGA